MAGRGGGRRRRMTISRHFRLRWFFDYQTLIEYCSVTDFRHQSARDHRCREDQGAFDRGAPRDCRTPCAVEVDESIPWSASRDRLEAGAGREHYLPTEPSARRRPGFGLHYQSRWTNMTRASSGRPLRGRAIWSPRDVLGKPLPTHLSGYWARRAFRGLGAAITLPPHTCSAGSRGARAAVRPSAG